MNHYDDNRPAGGDDNVTPVPGAETTDSAEAGIVDSAMTREERVATELPGDGVLPPAAVSDNDVLTVEQAAQLLQVSPKTVRKLFRRRQLPGGRKLGPKLIRFSKASVLEWLRGNASVSRRRTCP